VDCQPTKVRDAAATVGDLEPKDAGRSPAVVDRYLDHEAAEILGLGERPLDVGEDLAGLAGSHRSEERLNLLMRE
jgi:hypothetical protein